LSPSARTGDLVDALVQLAAASQHCFDLLRIEAAVRRIDVRRGHVELLLQRLEHLAHRRSELRAGLGERGPGGQAEGRRELGARRSDRQIAPRHLHLEDAFLLVPLALELGELLDPGGIQLGRGLRGQHYGDQGDHAAFLGKRWAT
jgi:hypothetical protein